jgi:hypothetical protein
MAITINVNGEEIDVTECASRNCGKHPMSDPKYRSVMMGGIFGRKTDPSIRDEYKKKLKEHSECIKLNCHPETGVEGSATLTGAPSRPNNTGGDGVGNGRATNDNPIVNPLPEQEESWFQRNKGIAYIGAGVIVLATVGTIIYIAKKK